MIIYLIVGQRKEHYLGEYAPEVLEAIDEYGNDENAGEWLETKLAEYRQTNEFEKVEIINISVPMKSIMAILRPQTQSIPAEIVTETTL